MKRICLLVFVCFVSLAGLFAQGPFTLDVKKQGIGEVTLSPAGGVYAAGTEVTLTASPMLSSVFYEWQGAASGTATTTTVTVNSNTSVTAVFSNSPYFNFKTPVGFASVNTGSTYPAFNTSVTGGQGATDTFRVNGPADFDALAWRLYYRNRAYRLGTTQNGVPKAPLVILIKSGTYPEGTSTSSAWGNSMLTIQEQGDLTIIGEAGTVLNFGLNVKRSWNILIRNLSFQDYYDDGINIGEPETHHVWVDHCTFGHATTKPADTEHPDGGLDIKAGASYVTVSWCLFRNSWKTSLIGASDNNEAQDLGRLKTTYFANYFYKTNSRNPRLRFGQVHVLSNLFESIDLYGNVSAYKGDMVSEGNFFLNTRWPMYADRTEADFNLVYGNNSDGVFTSKTGNLPATALKQISNDYDDSGLPVITAQINPAMLNPGGRSIKFDEFNAASAFNPASYYAYSPLPTSSLRQLLPLYAGAGKVDFFTTAVDIPEIFTTGELQPFTQNISKPSVAQGYQVSGIDLSASLTITPPQGFEVSANGGTTWSTNASPLVIEPVNGSVATALQVRLNSTTTGNLAGNITHSSTGASQVLVPVSGNAFEFIPPAGTAVVVSADGTGDFTSVQAAINAAPTGLTTPYIIFIKNGRYYEKITVPSNKPFIHLVGESVANVFIYHNTGASDPLPGGGTVGTQNSASFTVNATDFAAFNITFANTYGDGTQAVAVLVNNDRAVFQNCRFLGNQDTVYLKGSGSPRHYFKDCYIDGNVDFIFGSAIAVFDSTVIYAKSRTSTSSSYITAANTPAGQAYGFVFRNNLLPNNTGGTTYFLGRPWQNSNGANPVANNKTAFLSSRMSAVIKPAGWSVWDGGTNTSLIEYGEYNSRHFNGDAVDVAQRVAWSKHYNAGEAAAFSNTNLFGSWDPCAVAAAACANTDRDIAVSNFRVNTDATGSVFNWNISWAKSGIHYQLFRSANRSGDYEMIKDVLAENDTLVNFNLSDTLPTSGTAFYYYIVAHKAGYTSHITDTLAVSMEPAIIISGTLQTFFQQIGTPSPTQPLQLTGTNLSEPIVINIPANYQVSADGGATFITPPSTLVLEPVDGAVNVSLLLRLNASAVGNVNGTFSFSSSGATTVQVQAEGVVSTPNSELLTLQYWPLTSNGNDDETQRAQGVEPSAPTLRLLTLSNGTTLATVPAYSTQFGQAFGASTNGDGTWTTAVGGPGGTLRRTHYEQFTVTAKNGYRLFADSIYVKAAFYNTSSNTRLAIVFSSDGFVNDSSDIYSIPGGFANPITLANQTGGPTNSYALAFAIPNGVVINPGQTMSFRLYFSCGSSSAGRYAMLKELQVRGRQTPDVSLPLRSIVLQATRMQGKTILQWRTTGEEKVKHFEVEQSSDGSNFIKLATLAAQNAASANYSREVLQNLPVMYYRIRVVDEDGKTSYSNMVVVSQHGNSPLKVWPVPFSLYVQLQHAVTTGQGRFLFFNVDGKLVKQGVLAVGTNLTTISTGELLPGNYILKVFTNETWSQQHIIKQ